MQFITLAVATVAFSLWALSADAASISPADAASHIGESATVCGLVASANMRRTRGRSRPFWTWGSPTPINRSLLSSSGPIGRNSVSPKRRSRESASASQGRSAITAAGRRSS